MTLVPRLEITQKQSLVMTQKLRAAIDMLQMNNIELSELVAAEIDKNPLLERENFDEEVEKNNDYKEPELDIDVDNQFNNSYSGAEYKEKAKSNDFSSQEFDMDDLEYKKEESLYSHISRQIETNITDAKEKVIAGAFLMGLEPSGYLSEDFKASDLEVRFKAEKGLIERVLSKLQKFTPSGVFAKSLKESLKIQLSLLNKLDPMMAMMLDHLDLFMKRDLSEFKRVLKVSEEDVLSMLADIKLCNPKPGAEFSSFDNFHVVPDVFVRQNKAGDLRVELNSGTLIRPLINRQYIADLKAKSQDKVLHRFLNENENSANWLIKTIDQRNITVLKVATEIVAKQQDFFKYGIDYLKPLILAEIAENVEVDESTVSRVTSGKYMATPRGVFDMKFFFPSKLASMHSSETVKHKIKQLIDAETAESVLSDEEISLYLKKEGINVARRTVLKYRESLGIKPSNIRKREKKINEKGL